MKQAAFGQLIGKITASISTRTINQALESYLNETVPASGAFVGEILAACQEGIADGWMCQRSAGGIRYGRVLKPTPELSGFSVDVVQMRNVAGPYHAHPNGEIDLIMPMDGAAKFDGHQAGWLVYGPHSAHQPTVSDREAIILYLLPGGAIDFNAVAL